MSKKIEKAKKNYPNLKILHFAEVSHTTSVNQDSESKFGLMVGPPSGFTTLNISSNGYYSCGGYSPYIDKDMFLGSAKEQNVFDVWQSNNKLEIIREDSKKLIMFCNNCEKFKNKECQGSKYETELIRLLNPGVKNPTCIFGDGPSLLKLC